MTTASADALAPTTNATTNAAAATEAASAVTAPVPVVARNSAIQGGRLGWVKGLAPTSSDYGDGAGMASASEGSGRGRSDDDAAPGQLVGDTSTEFGNSGAEAVAGGGGGGSRGGRPSRQERQWLPHMQEELRSWSLLMPTTFRWMREWRTLNIVLMVILLFCVFVYMLDPIILVAVDPTLVQGLGAAPYLYMLCVSAAGCSDARGGVPR